MLARFLVTTLTPTSRLYVISFYAGTAVLSGVCNSTFTSRSGLPWSSFAAPEMDPLLLSMKFLTSISSNVVRGLDIREETICQTHHTSHHKRCQLPTQFVEPSFGASGKCECNLRRRVVGDSAGRQTTDRRRSSQVWTDRYPRGWSLRTKAGSEYLATLQHDVIRTSLTSPSRRWGQDPNTLAITRFTFDAFSGLPSARFNMDRSASISVWYRRAGREAETCHHLLATGRLAGLQQWTRSKVASHSCLVYFDPCRREWGTIEFALELVSRENNQGLAESLPGQCWYTFYDVRSVAV